MIRVISLGAGVQSSTMALMMDRDLLGGKPECAIFADTGDEPKAVMGWLNKLEGWLSYPVVRVSVGKLSMAATAPRPSKSGGYLKPSIPVYFKEGTSQGKGGRHCTMDFKIVPVQRFANSIRSKGQVEMNMGISIDEAVRMTVSQTDWITNKYPLVDARISRRDCYVWMEENGFPKPPRSACVYCPFHSDEEWLRLKREDPDDFATAVAFEKKYQEAALHTAFTGVPYLHKDRVPLSEVVFDPERTGDLFGNDCEGMCGV